MLYMGFGIVVVLLRICSGGVEEIPTWCGGVAF
jgi:hypothetical protein